MKDTSYKKKANAILTAKCPIESVRISLIPLSASTPDGGKATQLTVIGNDTGATSSITITNAVRVANDSVALD